MGIRETLSVRLLLQEVPTMSLCASPDGTHLCPLTSSGRVCDSGMSQTANCTPHAYHRWCTQHHSPQLPQTPSRHSATTQTRNTHTQPHTMHIHHTHVIPQPTHIHTPYVPQTHLHQLFTPYPHLCCMTMSHAYCTRPTWPCHTHTHKTHA